MLNLNGHLNYTDSNILENRQDTRRCFIEKHSKSMNDVNIKLILLETKYVQKAYVLIAYPP